MFKLKFEAYIFPKFNTEPQLNRRIVKFFSHIELTLTTLFKLLLSFLPTIFSGTKHGIRKIKKIISRERVKTLQRSSRVLGGEPSRAVFRASTGLDLPRIRNQSFLTFLGFRNSHCKIKETKRGFYKMITVWVGFRSFEICARFSWLSPPHCLLPQIPPLMPFSLSLYWIFSPLGKYFPEKLVSKTVSLWWLGK